MMNTVFTPKEIEIFKAWVQGRKNKEIAEDLGVSEPYVSQTVSKIQTKVTTLDNSFELLKDIGIIEPMKSLKLTDEGRKSFQRETLNIQKQTDKMMLETTLSFTPDSLEKTVVELIRSLTNPLHAETPHELAKRIGIPMNVIDATNAILYKITHHYVSVGTTPSLVVFVGGQMQPMLSEGFCNVVGQQYAEGWT